MKSITNVALGLTVFVLAVPATAAPIGPKVPERVSRRFEPAPLETQRLEGLLAARLQTNLEGRLLRVDEAGILDGFRHRPGKQEWIGEHAGKFLDAAARVWRYTKDARLKTLMDRVARELVATQEADGYLGTYTLDQRWTSWDVWVHKYDLMGLVAYHRATGDAAALAAAVRIGDLLVATFGPGKRDLVAAGTHVGMAATSVLGPMVDLYRQTGDERYLAFCNRIVAAYDQSNGPKIVTTLLATGDVHKTANAKAYEMISNLIGLVQLHAVTGDRRLLDAALAAWTDVAKNRLYVTGTASSREHFQDAHVLPGEPNHNVGETCVTVNWIELNLELFRLTGEARFADELERSVYNHLLGAQDGCNGDFCYYTPLDGKKPYGPGINCCVSSGPRGLSRIPELAWGRLDGAPAIVLWTAGQVELPVEAAGGRVTLRTRTDFPASGRVRVEVQPAKSARFAIHLRVPAWATRFHVAGVGDGQPGSFLRVERAWRRGDRLDVEMDLPVRLVDGAPSYPGRVAIVRGPQVLALDAALDPEIPDRALVALATTGVAPALAPVAPAKGGCAPSARWHTPGLTLASIDPGATRTTRELPVVPYADARTPQVWLLGADRVDDYLEARRARDRARARTDVRRATSAPTIDGRLDDALWTNPAGRRPLAKAVGPSRARSRASYDVAWDDAYVYVAAWVVDPTPQTRGDVSSSDHVAIAVDGNRDAEGMFDEREALVRHRWDESAVTTGIRRASARTKDGYTVEVAIPWSRLRRRPAPGLELAFEIRNHDQGLPGIEDDGDWQWASGEIDRYGVARLAK